MEDNGDMDAIKLQATIGDITAFDCRGGEPADQHRTIAEIDPADEDQVAIAELAADELNALGFELDVPGFGKARLQLRLMDGDGRS